MKTKILSLALIPAAALTLSGCSTFSSDTASPTLTAPSYKEASANEFIPTNQKAALALIAAAGKHLDKSRPLIVATLVNINALEESSAFGRLVAEQVSGQFTRNEFQVIEMKFRERVFMKQNVGELLLTREIKEVAQNHSAQAVIVGTYAESDRFIFVNLKLIRPGDNIVLSTIDYAVPMDKTVKTLIGRR